MNRIQIRDRRQTSWFWEQRDVFSVGRRVSANAKLVRLCLAMHATDDAQRAWPSYRTIAEECNLSIRSVQRALRELMDAGWVMVEHVFATNGAQRSNVYHLLNVPVSEEGGGHTDRGGWSHRQGGVVTQTTELESYEQSSNEQSISPRHERASVAAPPCEIESSTDGRMDVDELIARWEAETGSRLSPSHRRIVREWVARYGIERVTAAADEALVADLRSRQPGSRFRYWRRAVETPWTSPPDVPRAASEGAPNAEAYTSSPSADALERWKSAFPDLYD